MARTKIEPIVTRPTQTGVTLTDISNKQIWSTKRILEEYFFFQDEKTRNEIVKIVRERETLKNGIEPDMTMIEEYLSSIGKLSFLTEERVLANQNYYERYIDINKKNLIISTTYNGKEAEGYMLPKGVAAYINALIQFDAVGLGALVQDKVIRTEAEAIILLKVYSICKTCIEITPDKSDTNASRKGIRTRRAWLKDLKAYMSDLMQQTGISKTQSNNLAAKLLQYTI